METERVETERPDDRAALRPGGASRREVLRAGGLAAALLALGAGRGRAGAHPGQPHDATPAAEEGGGLPPGVALVEVAQIAPVELPGDPTAMAVYRLVMEPDAAIPTHPHPGLEVVVVEAGSASYLTEEGPAIQLVRPDGEEGAATPAAAGPGEEVTSVQGDTVIFPAGNVSDTRAGKEGATLLILELVAQAGEATPAA